jgi:hypothetical protein
MLIDHFHPQNTANFSQGFQVIDVNNEWAKGVVKNRAKSFHISPEKL